MGRSVVGVRRHRAGRRLTAAGAALALPVVALAALAPPALAAAPVYSVSATVSGVPTPNGVAVDPDTSTVYVSNSLSGTVTVIDGLTHQATGTIQVGDNPYGVAVDPVTHTVFVANSTGHTVSVVDEATSSVTATIDVGSSPYGVAVDAAHGVVLVTNSLDGTVSVVDEATRTVTATLSVGNNPTGVDVDATTGTAFVADTGSGTVSVIDDTGTPAVTATVPVGTNPGGVAVDPVRGTAYVTNRGDATVSVIEVASGTVTRTIPLDGASRVAVDPVSGTVYVTQYYPGEVYVVDEQTEAVVATLGVGSGASGVAVDPATSTAYVADGNDDAVSVITSGPAVAPGISGTPASPATAGTPYSFAYTLTGTPRPTTTLSQGDLPDGLSLSSDGVLSGTPTTPGSSTFTVTASNGVGDDATTTSTVVVDAAPAFTAASPALMATAGSPYTATFAASGSPTPTYELAPGAPPFLSIDATSGRVSGTPSAPGRFSYAVTATNRAGSSTTRTFPLTVVGAWPAAVQGFTAPTAGSAAGFTLGVTKGNTWTLEVTQPARTRTRYSGTITLDKGTFGKTAGVKLEAGDTFSVSGTSLTFSVADFGDVDGLTFTTSTTSSAVTLRLSVGSTPAAAGQIWTGQDHTASPVGSPLTYRRTTG